MITIQLSEPEARALIQLMALVVNRGCDMNTAEAALVLNRRVMDAVGAAGAPMKPNGAPVAKEDAR